jgi:hypothetical protein
MNSAQENVIVYLTLMPNISHTPCEQSAEILILITLITRLDTSYSRNRRWQQMLSYEFIAENSRVCRSYEEEQKSEALLIK